MTDEPGNRAGSRDRSDGPTPGANHAIVHGDKISIATGGGAYFVNAQVERGGVIAGHDVIGYTAEQVSALLTQLATQFRARPFDGRCPYLGLAAFTEDQAELFFGREQLIAELLEHLRTARFLVLAGPSGSGKSSLVRAGLLPALKRGALPQSEHWRYAILTPGHAPIESLAQALARLTRSPDAGDYLRQHHTEAEALPKLADSLLDDSPSQRLLLVIDQFEEIFTQTSREVDRLAFLNVLTHAVTQTNSRVMAVLALRSDFIPQCASYPQLNALLNQQFKQVGPMQPPELVNAIAQPALHVGLNIEPALIAQIVNDVQDEPGALPLMQFALQDLFDAQLTSDGVPALTLKTYLARGGLHTALQRQADGALARLNPAELALARTLFSGLIKIGHGTPDTRRTVTLAELTPVSIETVQLQVVAEKLAAAPARLLTLGEREQQLTVTLAHERLIEAWPWLRTLIDEQRAAIGQHQQLADTARTWLAQGRDVAELYRGRKLTEAKRWVQQHPDWLTAPERDFLAASHRRQHRVRLAQSIGLGLSAVVALILVGFALAERGPFTPRWVWRTVTDPDLQKTDVVELIWSETGVGYAGVRRPVTETALLRSQDGGQSWKPLPVRGREVLALATDNPATVYVSLAGSGLQRSLDGGETWQPIGRELAFNQIEGLAVTPEHAIAIADSRQPSGVWISRDQGETWSKFSAVPNITVFSLIWSNGRWLASTPHGILSITPDGAVAEIATTTWQANGLTEVNGALYASSLVGGLCVIEPSAAAPLTLDDAPLVGLAAQGAPSTQIVVATLSGLVLDWSPGTSPPREIASGRQLAQTKLINTLTLHSQVWVGTNTGLHAGQLRHWYQAD